MNKLKILIQKYGLWLILLTAFLVRIAGFRWMGYTDFPEFYRDYYMVNHIAHGQIVLLGPASMLHGFHFGPFYYYSMLPFYFLFGTHPYGLIFTGIIFSVLSVYAFYKILGLWFNNHQTAIIGALFMALSVYSLHLASYTSNPNFLPLFVLWYFYELTKILEDRTFTPSRPTSTVEEWRDPLRLRSGLRLADTRPQMSRRVGSRSAEHSGSVGIAQYKDYIF
jgi:4-amino-4-deoxy-L-arabinose transferase-like glycosyltransferase